MTDRTRRLEFLVLGRSPRGSHRLAPTPVTNPGSSARRTTLLNFSVGTHIANVGDQSGGELEPPLRTIT
jgi:hypothetical protein